MNSLKIFFVAITCVAIILVAGCKSSEESSQQKDDKVMQVPPLPPKQEVKTGDKVDTVDVTMQNSQKPSYEPSSKTPATSGYSVQVGAYKMQDNADRVAQLAKERFTQQVYTYPDKVSGLFKVMIGNFVTKDEARKFRDEMAQRFPSDYKDAWVSDNTQK